MTNLDVFSIEENELDTLAAGSIVALAQHTGVLLLEEQDFPELVRVRLKRNTR